MTAGSLGRGQLLTLKTNEIAMAWPYVHFVYIYQ